MFNSLILRARLFDFHAKHVWKFHRELVRRHLSPRCQRCSLSVACSPLDGNGVLLNLRFHAVGAAGSVSPIVWERFMLNEGLRMTATDGQVELSATAQD